MLTLTAESTDRRSVGPGAGKFLHFSGFRVGELFLADIEPGFDMEMEGSLDLYPALKDGRGILDVSKKLSDSVVNVLARFREVF